MKIELVSGDSDKSLILFNRSFRTVDSHIYSFLINIKNNFLIFFLILKYKIN